jgi:hypothetical protein
MMMMMDDDDIISQAGTFILYGFEPKVQVSNGGNFGGGRGRSFEDKSRQKA